MNRIVPGLILTVQACLALAGGPERAPHHLLQPDLLRDRAPERFRVKFETTEGDFVVEVNRIWAPRGADRFYNLVTHGYYDDCKFFRVIPSFVVQWGIHGDPAVARAWSKAVILDDAVGLKNLRGAVSFAMAGRATRTTEIFVNLKDNADLDRKGFAPFGKVVTGIDVLEKLNSEYGEVAPDARGPDPRRIEAEGNAYLDREFPRLDAVLKATVLEERK